MQVRIVAERCQGHGMCNMVCPTLFKYDDDGFGYVVPGLEQVPADLVDDVRLAEVQCPERAVVIEQ